MCKYVLYCVKLTVLQLHVAMCGYAGANQSWHLGVQYSHACLPNLGHLVCRKVLSWHSKKYTNATACASKSDTRVHVVTQVLS